MKKTLTLVLLLIVALWGLQAQQCHLVSLNLDIPTGVTKHHFPIQEMPVIEEDEVFTFLAKWSEGELVTRIRFSKDGDDWTSWEVLKRDFNSPTDLNSPLNMVDQSYQYFEWAVFNKAGLATELSLDFYYPESLSSLGSLSSVFELETSTVGCPNPTPEKTIITPETVVVNTNENEK